MDVPENQQKLDQSIAGDTAMGAGFAGGKMLKLGEPGQVANLARKAMTLGKTVMYMKGGQLVGKALGLPYGDIAGLILGSQPDEAAPSAQGKWKPELRDQAASTAISETQSQPLGKFLPPEHPPNATGQIEQVGAQPPNPEQGVIVPLNQRRLEGDRLLPAAPGPTRPPNAAGQIERVGSMPTSEQAVIAPAAPTVETVPEARAAAGPVRPIGKAIGDLVNQAYGVQPLKANVPLREQLPTAAGKTTEVVTDPIKLKYPDPAVRQMVRANGEKIVDAVANDPATMRAIHDLTRVELRQALINSGEDMGQTTISSSKFAGSGSITRQQAFDRLIDKGLAPQEIVRLAKTSGKPVEFGSVNRAAIAEGKTLDNPDWQFEQLRGEIDRLKGVLRDPAITAEERAIAKSQLENYESMLAESTVGAKQVRPIKASEQ